MDQFEAVFTLLADEPVFAGHFPDNPVFPGVLALALVRETVRHGDGALWEVASIARQKLVRPLVPGDEVKVRCRVLKRSRSSLMLDCKLMFYDGSAVAGIQLCLEPIPGDGVGT